jgi:hypothetical protein
MLVGLPILGCILPFVLCRMRGISWREAFLHAATAGGAIAVLSTEGLSLIRFLSPLGLTVAWLMADLLFVTGIWYSVHYNDEPQRRMPTFDLRSLNWCHLGLLAGVTLVVAAVGLNALLSPPNTPDVMTYHLPRVVHWLQQRGVAFYPTQESRQLQMAPGAEYLVFQLHALSGGDRLDNLIQWCSFVGCIVGVSLIAKEMGAGARGQALAAVVSATIPEGILQASGAGNDYVLAFWLTAETWYFMHFSHTERAASIYGIGSAAALAGLTKPTALIIMPPLVLILSLAWTKNCWKLFFKMLPSILLLVLAVDGGYWARNTQRYGSLLGPTNVREFKLTNDSLTVRTVTSNAIRSAALHMATPNIAVNKALERFLIRLIHACGADENDRGTTWKGTTFHIAAPTLDEAVAGNPAHLALILMTMVVVVISPSLRRSYLMLYISGLVLAFVAFCAVLRWQPYHVRLHLPLFVLWSPAIGTVLERHWRDALASSLGFVLLLLAAPAVLRNQARPLLNTAGGVNVFNAPRDSLYFADRPALFVPYAAAAALVNATGCRVVGLDLPPSSYEYPLLVLLNAQNGEKDVRYVEGFSDSGSNQPGPKQPMCALICLECIPAKRALYEAEVGPPALFPGWVTVFTTRESVVPSPFSPR